MASAPGRELILAMRIVYVMRHPLADGVSSYRCTLVQSATLPRLVTSWASVTNSNADGRVASVTTDRSVNLPIGSAPVVVNSVPTEAGPSGASSVSRRVVAFCRSPAHDRWLRRSANTSKTCSADARLSPTTRTSISRLRAFAPGPCLVCPPTAHLLLPQRREKRAPSARAKDREDSLSFGRDVAEMPKREGGHLGAALEVELRENAAHVVAGGLRRDIQTCRDLGVRETLAQQRKHLALALRERLRELGTGAGRPAQLPDQRRRLVGLAGSSEPLERLGGQTALARREFGFVFLDRASELDPHPCLVEGQLQPPERGERRLQPLTSRWVARHECHACLREVEHRDV